MIIWIAFPYGAEAAGGLTDGAETDMISRRMDEDSGILHVTSVGVPTRAIVDEHYTALRRMIEPHRLAGRSVRLLSDVRESARTTPELEEHILAQMAQTFRPGDRVVLLTSDDDRGHIRQVLSGVAVGAFSSLIAAEMWLVSEDLAKTH